MLFSFVLVVLCWGIRRRIDGIEVNAWWNNFSELLALFLSELDCDSEMLSCFEIIPSEVRFTALVGYGRY